MARYGTLKLKNVTYRRVNYATFSGGVNMDYDENLTPVKYSKLTYNFNYKNGALVQGLGIDPIIVLHNNIIFPDYTKILVVPDELEVVATYTYKRMATSLDLSWQIFYCADGSMYYNNLHSTDQNYHLIPDVTFSSPPLMFNYMLNGEYCLICTTPNDGMWVLNGNKHYKVENAPKITSFCLHYERLFVTVDNDRAAVWFSDDLDPTNWEIGSDKAGFIQMYDDRGDVLKVVSFNDYVYIFREYGISRLTAYAKQEEFDLTNLFVSSSRIYKDSITVCGDRIIFLASDGLYVFNGSTTSKIQLNINALFTDEPNITCHSAFNNGYYYLACRLHFNDGHNKVIGTEQTLPHDNNALLQLNISTGELSIGRGYNIVSLDSVCTRSINALLASVEVSPNHYKLGMVTNCGKIIDTPTVKYWKSPSTDFGIPNTPKTLRDLYYNAKGDVTVYIEVDGVTHAYTRYDLVGEIRHVRINLKGYKFAVNFESSDDNVTISNPQAIIGY